MPHGLCTCGRKLVSSQPLFQSCYMVYDATGPDVREPLIVPSIASFDLFVALQSVVLISEPTGI